MIRAGALLLAAIAACRAAAPAPPRIENRPVEGVDAARVRGPITRASVEQLLATRFARQLAAGTYVTEWSGTADDVLAELAAMGWVDLGELAAAIPRDFDVRAAHQFTADDPANIPGTLRDVMILHDARRYFERAWDHHWASLAPGDLEVYRAYSLDLGPLRAAGVMGADADGS
ncbi:MAG: hypothetical protein IPL61_15695 [Myxococcales bacterium]|nr:hypothetical protein [Myxococcales bacterium]